MEMFNVIRDCCTSGNCITCNGKTPFGKSLRVLQWGPTTDKAKAERIAKNWAAYNGTVEPATAEGDVQ